MKHHVIIALLAFIIILLFFRNISFGDELNSPSSSVDPSKLEAGAVLMREEGKDCDVQYGVGWTNFTSKLCKKA